MKGSRATPQLSGRKIYHPWILNEYLEKQLEYLGMITNRINILKFSLECILLPLRVIQNLNLNFMRRVPMESMGLGATANTVQNLAKNFHYSQFQLSEIAAKGNIFLNVPRYH